MDSGRLLMDSSYYPCMKASLGFVSASMRCSWCRSLPAPRQLVSELWQRSDDDRRWRRTTKPLHQGRRCWRRASNHPWTVWPKQWKGYLSRSMIAVLPMVRTEADMSVHQSIFLQWSPPRQQPGQPSPPPSRHPLWNLPYEDLSDEEELIDTFYQEDNFEDEAYDGRMTYERGPRQRANPKSQ